MGIVLSWISGFILSIIICCIALKIGSNHNHINNITETICAMLLIVTVITGIICGIASAVSGITAIDASLPTTNEIKYEQMLDKRDNLVYQLEHQMYLNDNNLGTTELMNEVHEFNEDVIEGKIALHRTWTNWLAYKFWDDIETIDLNNYQPIVDK